MLPGAFPDKLVPIVDSTVETVVQSDVSKVCSFIKKRPQYRCFPVNIAKLSNKQPKFGICEFIFW